MSANYRRTTSSLALAGGLVVTVVATLQDPNEDGTVLSADEERVVGYSRDADLADPIGLLMKRAEAGKASLAYDKDKGYLPALLKAMKVPVSSQTLVFSKTSSQGPHTSPSTPRALYFNDKVFVGWAQGADLIDLAGIDPKKGPVFYTLDQSDPRRLKIKRQNDCVSCHIGPHTLQVPSLIVRSVYTEPNGAATALVQDFISGHNNKLRDRWGGWYVTGTHGNDSHLGNVFLKEAQHKTIDLSETSNLTSLDDRFDTSKYLSPHSDAVALLVLDHLVRMQTYITRARFETLYAEDQIAQNPNNEVIANWSKDRVSQAGEALLAYMLFRDEAALNGPIKGTSTFEQEFIKVGPFDKKGRTLRAFDLKKRVFKYPCSYLIYSEAFDQIPKQMKDYLWWRLDEILTGKHRKGLYEKMDDVDRQAVLEILMDTKPEFREFRKQAARS